MARHHDCDWVMVAQTRTMAQLEVDAMLESHYDYNPWADDGSVTTNLYDPAAGTDPLAPTQETTAELQFEHFPDFPWKQDDDVSTKTRPLGQLPKLGLTARQAGGSNNTYWRHGEDLLEPLFWYWDTMQTPVVDVHHQAQTGPRMRHDAVTTLIGMTPVEMMIDFVYSTHVFPRPGNLTSGVSTHAMVEYFLSASRRLFALCNKPFKNWYPMMRRMRGNYALRLPPFFSFVSRPLLQGRSKWHLHYCTL